MIGHANRGKPLERAIARAAKRCYADRCELRKQETPTATSTERGVFYAAGAPIDFLGVHQGQALALEAKLVTRGASLPLERWDERQRRALGHQHQLGAWTRLVIAFDEHGETFAIDWPPLASFLAAPWRESLSLDWCRAYGELVPDGPRLDPKARVVRFLEPAEHADKVGAAARVLEERSAWLLRHARKPQAHSAKGPRTWSASEYRQATPEQRFEHTIGLMAYGAKRAASKRGRR